MSILELRVPPVLVTLSCAFLMSLATVWTPAATDFPWRRPIALGLAVLGMAIALAGVAAFRSASTTVHPVRVDAASALVDSGIYRLTRNPMYLGMLAVLAGWAVWLGGLTPLLALPLFVAFMTRFQIVPEERALRTLFGESFERYARSTRRWL